jgi:hypothetical protein
MPSRIGVESHKLADIGRPDYPCLLRAGQDLRVASDGANCPRGQHGPHLREVPVCDGLDTRYPHPGLGEQRPGGPRGAVTARDHVLDDHGPGSVAWRALDERAADSTCLGAHVGQRKL